jgi:hypothetical protein
MNMPDLEVELETVTKLKPKKSEEPGGDSRGGYLQKLMDTISELPETDWDGLSADAQKWYNEGAKALKAQEPIPDFADNAEEEETDEEDEEDEGDEHEEETDMAMEGQETGGTKQRSKKAKPKPKAKAKPTAAPKKAKPKEGNSEKKPRAAVALKPDAVKVRIKKAIIKDPQISLEDLCALLSKGGTKISKITTAGVRSEFRHSLRVLQQEGLIKIDL